MTERICAVCLKIIDDNAICFYTPCCKKFIHLECKPLVKKKYSYKKNIKCNEDKDKDKDSNKCNICGKERVDNKAENENNVEQSDTPHEPIECKTM